MPYSSIGMTESFEKDTRRVSRAMHRSTRRLSGEVDNFMHLLAFSALGISQRRSAGVVDPTEKFPHLAWKIPVRRITGEYYRSWKVRRIKRGHWLVYNGSREAFFIELGIHHSARRVRRPIAKMTLIDMSKRVPKLLPQLGSYVFDINRRGSFGSGGGL